MHKGARMYIKGNQLALYRVCECYAAEGNRPSVSEPLGQGGKPFWNPTPARLIIFIVESASFSLENEMVPIHQWENHQ